MKKLLKIIGAILALIAMIIAIFILIDSNDRAVITKYVKNENLKTVRADWRGTPVDEKDRFVNHEHPFLPKMIDVVKWQLGARPLKEAKKGDTSRLEVRDPAEFLQSERDGILWLGHASVFIR